MTSSFSLIPVLFLLGAAHGVFLVGALFANKSGPQRANRYLGCYTLVFACALFDYFLDMAGLTNAFIYVRTLLWPKEFLYGVLIYFYTRELTQPHQYRLQGKQWWHFAPVILHMMVTWPLLFLSPEWQTKVLLGDSGISGFLMMWSVLLGEIELILTILHITVYLVLSIQLTLVHQRLLLQRFANVEKINVYWLRNLLIGTLTVYFIWLADEFIAYSDGVEYWLDIALGLSMVVLIYGMSILGLRQPQPVSLMLKQEHASVEDSDNGFDDVTTEVNAAVKQKPQRYLNSPLTNSMSVGLFQQLEQRMSDQKLFTDNTLSLPKLAEVMGVSVNYLSQVINQQANQNFFDFINRYRVHEVQRLMREKPDRTVLDLAMNAGFNSKSAFYTAFRKNIGMTPSQYKKSFSNND